MSDQEAVTFTVDVDADPALDAIRGVLDRARANGWTPPPERLATYGHAPYCGESSTTPTDPEVPTTP